MSDEEWVQLLYGPTWEIGFVVDHWYAIRLTGGVPAVLRAPTPGELQQKLREAEQPPLRIRRAWIGSPKDCNNDLGRDQWKNSTPG